MRRTIPPIRLGSTVRVARPAARGLLDRLHDRRGLVVGELVRSRELDRRRFCACATSASSPGRSPRARRRGPSRPRAGRSCARARRPRRELPSTSALPAGSICGLRRNARSSGTRPSRARARRGRATASTRSASCAASKSARAYMRCATATSRSFSSAEKSSSAIASSMSRRWSSASSTLPVTRAVASSVRSATSERIRSSERFVSASIWRFVSSSRRARSASAPPSRARSARRRPCARRRGSRGLALRVGDQLAVLLEELARLFARLVGLVDGRANRSRARRWSSGSGRTRT